MGLFHRPAFLLGPPHSRVAPTSLSPSWEGDGRGKREQDGNLKGLTPSLFTSNASSRGNTVSAASALQAGCSLEDFSSAGEGLCLLPLILPTTFTKYLRCARHCASLQWGEETRGDRWHPAGDPALQLLQEEGGRQRESSGAVARLAARGWALLVLLG